MGNHHLSSGGDALLTRRLSLAQFIIFALVGATGTLVHYSILLSLVELFGQKVIWATILGSLAGAIVNFFLNHRLTFRSLKSISQTAPRFAIVALCGLLANAGLMYLFGENPIIGYFWTQMAVTLTVLLMNYIINALWTFRW